MPSLTLGELAVRVETLPGTTKCADIERLLVRSRTTTSIVAVRGNGRPFLVDRLAFLHLMAGPIGYGRTLYNDRPIAQVMNPETLVMPASTTVAAAFEQLLERPPKDRFNAIVVRFPDGTYGLVESTHLLERVAEMNANAAQHDPLTGLGNRSLLMDTIARALGVRGLAVALLFVDLDRFKVVNDGMGHDAGDALLRTIAERIRHTVGDRGLTARLGGDEFAIALIGDSQSQLQGAAEALAFEVIETVRASVRLGDRNVITSASCGIAMSARGDDANGLLRRADIAMYQAKRAGGAQYRMFRGEQDTAARERLDVEIWLRHSLTRGGLRVVYQPIVDLRTGRPRGFEALVRGVHPERGVLNPIEFLPVAEEIGMMPEIDAWVMEQGLGQLRRWHRRGASHLDLAVNLSAQTLGRPESLERFKTLLEQSGTAPSSILLEITESEALNDLHTTEALLLSLRALGARIAIDDFGTGYSSLAQLATLPLDVLKIDRSFIARLGLGDRGEEMVRIIVALARGLRAETVAEGIESREQADALLAMGCEFGQGYLYAPPLQADDAFEAVDLALGDARIEERTSAA